MRIAVIGQGYVGTAFREFVEDHFECVTYDPSVDSTYPVEEIAACEFAAICVPTPMSTSGACDLSIVDEAISRLPNQRILIKSTVSPGATEMFAEKYNK